jgi:hypothetical protein
MNSGEEEEKEEEGGSITWNKTWTLQKYKERKQEQDQDQDLDLKIKMSKCMANICFYRLKFRTIGLMTNY